MVQLHAYRADIPPSRITKDVDMVVDVVGARASIQAISGQLRTIGFEGEVPQTKSAPAYRFSRGKEQIDLMVPDELPPGIKPRLMMRDAFGVVAGKQAIRRRDTFIVRSGAGLVTLASPDVLGAIIVKGAANQVTSAMAAATSKTRLFSSRLSKPSASSTLTICRRTIASTSSGSQRCSQTARPRGDSWTTSAACEASDSWLDSYWRPSYQSPDIGIMPRWLP